MELGWKIGAMINPLLYTYSDWQKRNFTPFYKNVEQESIEILISYGLQARVISAL